ncbi:WD40/YVTN/BNR-like repeat-containing protein [Candidatus Omnitrophota bacterium]
MKNLLIIIMAAGLCFLGGVFFPEAYGENSQEMFWDNIGKEIVEVNTVWVDSQNPKVIIIGANRGVFKTKDGGDSWQVVLIGTNKRVNFLYADRQNNNLIYVGTSSGLFLSRNQCKTWKRIYQNNSEEEVNCLGIIEPEKRIVYLGTQAGLIISQDNGRTWSRFSGSLGKLPILAITEDRIGRFIYLVTSAGAYQIDQLGGAKRIFATPFADSQDNDSYSNTGQDTESEETDSDDGGLSRINYISIDPVNPQNVYLATDQGVFMSSNKGISWSKLSCSGLLKKEVDFIAITANSLVLAGTRSGIFAYNQEVWQEVSLRLTMRDIRFLALDNSGTIYAAGDKGLFKGRQLLKSNACFPKEADQEPPIQRIQQAAIEYAQVIAPRQIAAHRRLARLKAILPDLSLDYDKSITSYNNSTCTRFSVGPLDWGVSLKWSLGDLIWSEQQRLIDSQVRLMVKLRQDILDEVTRLYFQRQRLKAELNSAELAFNKRQEKELRFKELTALLDGLTGGLFSEGIK